MASAEKSGGKGRRIKMTLRTVDAIRATNPKGEWYAAIPDKDSPEGFGVIAYPTGRKTFVFRYRAKSGQRRFKTIGPLGRITLAKALEKARELASQATLGGDPAMEEKERRAAPSFEKWARTYIEEIRRGPGNPDGKKTWKRDVQYLLDPDTTAHFQDKKLRDINSGDVAEFHRQTRKKRGRVAAVRAMASLKAALNAAWSETLIEVNPVLRYTKNPRHKKLLQEPPPRKRYFDEAEWGRMLEAIGSLPDPHARAALILLAATGCRLSEILNARWEDLDHEKGLLRLPETKSGEAQDVPLPWGLFGSLAMIPRASVFIVAGLHSDKPRADLKRAWARVCKEAGLNDAHIHDIRRSVGQQIRRAHGLDAERLALRHSSPEVTAKHYGGEDAEHRRAYLESIIPQGVGNILCFARKHEAEG